MASPMSHPLSMRALSALLFLFSIFPVSAFALPDPTLPPAALRQDAASATPVSPVLQAILTSRERAPAAVINGQTVPLGGWVGGAKLIKIGADHVVLKGPQGKQTLRLLTQVRKTRPTYDLRQDKP